MNKVIVINPTSLNIMKAIVNCVISNIVDITIFGSIKIIKKNCDKLNVNINILKIISCESEEELFFKLTKYNQIVNISGIIVDNIKETKIKEYLDYNSICHIIDYGIFKKSIFVINDSNKININNKMTEIINLIDNLNINNIKIGLVSSNLNYANLKSKQLQQQLTINNIDIIDLNDISKCCYNIIIFENNQIKQSYIKQINELILPRIIEINKTSNSIILDAHNKKFKNIFFQFVFLSKINLVGKELNTQTV